MTSFYKHDVLLGLFCIIATFSFCYALKKVKQVTFFYYRVPFFWDFVKVLVFILKCLHQKTVLFYDYHETSTKKKNTKQKQAAIITSTHPDFSESKFFYPPISGIGRHSSKFKALKKPIRS